LRAPQTMRPRAWLDENRKRTGVFGTALRVPLMLAVFANLLSSCAVVLVNKWLVAQHRFDHIIFLTSCQMAFTAAGMRVMLRCGVFAHKACERRTVVRVAGASLLAMAFMNLNLKQNSVGFFQMTKLACIPCTLATQYLAGDRFPDGATLATLVPLVGGLYVAEVHDHTVTPLGTLYGAVAVVATVLAQRATASSQRRLRVDSNQLLYHTSPLIALAMLAASPLCDDVAHLAALDWTADLRGDVLWSCAVWKSTSELCYPEKYCVDFVSLHAIEPTWPRGQCRVDGVGRPKFDFHTGPARSRSPRTCRTTTCSAARAR